MRVLKNAINLSVSAISRSIRIRRRKASVEPHGYVERHLGEGRRSRGAQASRAVSGGLAENDYVHVMQPFDACRPGQARRAPPSERRQRASMRASTFLSRELRANDTDLVPQCCQSPRAVSDERLRRVLRRALPRYFLVQLRFLRRRISQVNSRHRERL
jgi:hypothetical protein